VATGILNNSRIPISVTWGPIPLVPGSQVLKRMSCAKPPPLLWFNAAETFKTAVSQGFSSGGMSDAPLQLGCYPIEGMSCGGRAGAAR